MELEQHVYSVCYTALIFMLTLYLRLNHITYLVHIPAPGRVPREQPRGRARGGARGGRAGVPPRVVRGAAGLDAARGARRGRQAALPQVHQQGRQLQLAHG